MPPLQSDASNIHYLTQVFVQLDQQPITHEDPPIIRGHNLGDATLGFYQLLEDNKLGYLKEEFVVFPDKLDAGPQVSRGTFRISQLYLDVENLSVVVKSNI